MPGSVLHLPALTRPRIDPSSPSTPPLPSHFEPPTPSHSAAGTPSDPAETDAAVRAALARGESLCLVDEPLLESLRPDLILTQDLCRVCSIDLAAVQKLAARLPGPPRIVSFNPATVEDVLDDLLRIGTELGPAWAGVAAETMVALRERLFRAEEFVNPYEDGPVVGFLEWTDPLFCAGHWTVQLIERAGARHPWNMTVAKPGSGAALGPQRGARSAPPSHTITPEALVQARPDALVIAPCGLSLAQARACAARLAGQPWWNDLPAVRNGRVAIVDGNQMFNRPGPRIVDAFEFLVGWLHDRPSLIPKGFPWARLG